MTVRQPRCYLALNGAVMGCIEAKVCRKAKRSADTFSAKLSITYTSQFGLDLAQWADFQPTDASIIMSSAPGGGDQQVMITGTIDKPEIDWAEMTVEVSGRDKSASLTEKKRTQKFINQTSSDIASTIAQDHGLTASVVDSGSPAGKIYDQDTVHLTLNRNDHEIMSGLAEAEGYRWYVEGDSLYFEPQEQDSDVYTVTWTPPTPDMYATGTAISLTTSRNMTAARPHTVTVKSWHHKMQKMFVGTATVSGVGDQIEHIHHHPGKTQDQVDKLAKSRAKNATRHDCSVSLQMPGDLTVDPRMKLQLHGTGTIYDNVYDIESVDFAMSWDEGFTMDISCKAPKAGRS